MIGPVLEMLAHGRRNQTDDLAPLVQRALRDPKVLATLVTCTTRDEAIPAARAAWVVRRVAEKDVSGLRRHRAFLVRESTRSATWEVRAELCHVLPRLELTRPQVGMALEFLRACQRDSSRIVQTWSLDALCRMAESRKSLVPEARKLLLRGQDSPHAAVRARERNLLARWKKNPPGA